jgi:hypothetical protein
MQQSALSVKPLLILRSYGTAEQIAAPKDKSKTKIKGKNLAGRFRGIPPLRKKRARMGHPSFETARLKPGFSGKCAH